MGEDGRTIWWPKDVEWWFRERIVILGIEFGSDGPAVIDYLSCRAKAQNDGGKVKDGYTAIARGCFVDGPDKVREIVARAAAVGLLDEFEQGEWTFRARVSGLQADTQRALNANRQARHREGGDGALPSVTDRELPSPTGQERSKNSNVESGLDDSGTINELFAFWQQRCGHGHAKLTSERKAKLKARLKQGYTVEQIRTAIDGAAVGAFVDPETGKKHDDLTLICRNGSKLEDFIDRGQRAKPRQNGNGDRPSVDPAAWREQYGQPLVQVGWDVERVKAASMTATGQRSSEAEL